MGRYEELWRVIWTLIFILFGFVAVFSTAHSAHVIVYDSKYADLATVVLGGAALILAGVSVVVAVGAIWGYREVKETLERAAEKAARETATTVAFSVTTELVTREVEARLGKEASAQRFGDAYNGEDVK